MKLQEFESKEELLRFVTGVACMNLKSELESLTEKETDEYDEKLQNMSLEELCVEFDWLYYLSGK